MTGLDLLTMQVGGSFDRVVQCIGQAKGDAWTTPAFAGANPAGFTLWHCARTLDWTVNCAIRGVDEVARREPWSDRVRGDSLFGAGSTPEDALAIAGQVGREDLLAYTEAVRADVMGWLAAQDDASLDAVPDFRAHQARSGYDAPAVWGDIADLEGIPAWQLLARPAVAHIRTHVGEVDILLQAISRSAPSASA